MRKKCSIRLLVFGIIVTAAISLSVGFFAGTQKNWKAYEERIALLQEQKDILLAQRKTEDKNVESLKVVEPYEYVLLAEDGFVAVYHTDRKTLYASTDILIQELPEELQEEINEGKFIGSEEQLYNFLENYSS